MGEDKTLLTVALTADELNVVREYADQNEKTNEWAVRVFIRAMGVRAKLLPKDTIPGDIEDLAPAD